MTNESTLREEIVRTAKSIFDRGLTHGSTGNISAKLEDGWLLTPTGSSLGTLDPAKLSKLDWNGNLISGDRMGRVQMHHRADVRVGLRAFLVHRQMQKVFFRWFVAGDEVAIPVELRKSCRVERAERRAGRRQQPAVFELGTDIAGRAVGQAAVED